MFTILDWHLLADDNGLEYRFSSEAFGDFSEHVYFPSSVELARYIDQPALRQLIDLSALFVGVSYYKASAEDSIVSATTLGSAGLQSVISLYTDGLGEFYARNSLDFPPKISFDILSYDSDQRQVSDSELRQVNENNPIVAFGGGKDSHAAIDICRRAGKTPVLVSVVLSQLVQTKLESMVNGEINCIRRQIDQKLIRLNASGEALNGHIPVTAINSVLLTIYAVCTQSRWVVFSNERGASVATCRYHNYDVNHQFSKSLQFEQQYRHAVSELFGNSVQYFSILRACSELWIAAYVATCVSQAHQYLASCNRNFIIAGSHALPTGTRWCGSCSKCVFCAIIFAPYLDKAQFLNLFDNDILNDAGNLQHAMDLCGVGDAKPWECVGDVDDTSATLQQLSTHSVWKDHAIPLAMVQLLEKKHSLGESAQRIEMEMQSQGEHCLPDSLSEIMSSLRQLAGKQQDA